MFVTNLVNDPCFSMEAAHVAAKLWGRNLTKHKSRHLVWTEKMRGGFCLKELACWAVGTSVYLLQSEQPLIPGGETMLLRR